MKFPELGSTDRPLPSLPIALSVAGILTLRAATRRVCSGPSRNQFRLSCPGQSLGMVELAGARRLPAALSRSPPLTPFPRLGPQVRALTLVSSHKTVFVAPGYSLSVLVFLDQVKVQVPKVLLAQCPLAQCLASPPNSPFLFFFTFTQHLGRTFNRAA